MLNLVSLIYQDTDWKIAQDSDLGDALENLYYSDDPQISELADLILYYYGE